MKGRMRSYGWIVRFIVPVLMLLLMMIFVPRPSTGFYAVYIHPSVDRIGEATLQRVAQSGINTVFTDIYYPTGIGTGVFLAEKKAIWTGSSREPKFSNTYSLDETITNAKKLGLSVHVTVSCFGEVPAIDPTNEAHQLHLREIVAYILTNFPSISGIHLDYVRYINEWGVSANGNTRPITSFTRDMRQVVKGKALSAAVLAAANWEDYNATRFRTGQDCRDISQYLDFMCPMAYHLAFGRSLEWIGSVTRFMTSLAQDPCRIYPTVQAYFQTEREIIVSNQKNSETSILGQTVEVPSTGLLQFDVSWQKPENRFSLTVRDSLSREMSVKSILRYRTQPTRETYVFNFSTTGLNSMELKVQALSSGSDVVTVHVSDVDEEFPGYEILGSAISMATILENGFCVYALNNISPRELQAIKDSTFVTRMARMRYL